MKEVAFGVFFGPPQLKMVQIWSFWSKIKCFQEKLLKLQNNSSWSIILSLQAFLWFLRPFTPSLGVTTTTTSEPQIWNVLPCFGPCSLNLCSVRSLQLLDQLQNVAALHHPRPHMCSSAGEMKSASRLIRSGFLLHNGSGSGSGSGLCCV